MSAASPAQTIVVTGAGSGIGRATALRLAVAGTRVLALDRDAGGAAETALAARAAGGEAVGLSCDVTDEAAVAGAVGSAERIDVLVNCAGIFGDRPLAEVTAEDLRRMYEVNAVGLFTVTRLALERMPDGGRIVNVASRAYLGSRDHAHYVASKAAVVGLTRTLALELAPRRIAVNAVAPGPVRTPMLAALGERRLSELAASYPGGRMPEPEDVAHTIAFFADPATRFVTGQVLLIDGGRSVGLSGA